MEHSQDIRLVPRAFLLWMAVGLLSGCFTIDRDTQSGQFGLGSSEKPGRILIYDFALLPQESTVDLHAAESLQFGRPDLSPKKEHISGPTIATMLSARVVEELNRRGLFAERAPGASTTDENVLVIKGRFFTDDRCESGDGRFFEEGGDREEMSAWVQVFQRTPRGLHQLTEFAVTSKNCWKSSPKPPPPIGPYQVPGSLRSFEAPDGDIQVGLRHMADETIARLENYYVRKGWLTQSDVARSATGQ